jgi:hypothetical protein
MAELDLGTHTIYAVALALETFMLGRNGHCARPVLFTNTTSVVAWRPSIPGTKLAVHWAWFEKATLSVDEARAFGTTVLCRLHNVSGTLLDAFTTSG